MQVKKTSLYEVLFEMSEVKDALVHWLARGPRSTVQTGEVAVKINNSECAFELEEDRGLTINFDWEENDEGR